MSSVPISYTSSTLSDLADDKYEAWLLEAVYDIANQPLAVSPGDGLFTHLTEARQIYIYTQQHVRLLATGGPNY